MNSNFIYFNNLRNNIVNSFTLAELEILTNDMGIDFENIPGNIKEHKVLELIKYVDRRAKLAELIFHLKKARPHIKWEKSSSEKVLGLLVKDNTIPQNNQQKPTNDKSVFVFIISLSIFTFWIGSQNPQIASQILQPTQTPLTLQPTQTPLTLQPTQTPLTLQPTLTSIPANTIYENQGIIFANKGHIAFSKQLYEDAILSYTQAMQNIQGDYDIYLNRGISYKNVRKYDLSLQDINKATIISPNNPRSYLHRALLYYEQKIFRDAIKDFTKYLELNLFSFDNQTNQYSNGYIYVLRGYSYYKSDQFNKAIEDFESAINEGQFDGYYYRANIYYEQNNKQSALKDYEKYISLEPNGSYVKDAQKMIDCIKTCK